MSWPKRNTFDVFVGNLPNDVDKGYIDHLFRNCGEISSVSVLNSKFTKSKLAYIRFHCEPDALKAVEKYRTLTLNGNSLEVKLLPPRSQNNDSVVKNTSLSSSSNGLLSGAGDSTSFVDVGMTSSVFNKVSIPCSLQKSSEITIVCHIENPVTFYGQRISNLLEISTIGEKLQMYCMTYAPVQDLPHVNQIYATRFSQDQMWYRCRVMCPDLLTSYVSYIDYGNSEHVNNIDIVVLPDDLVRIPPQSCMFVFKDLAPVTVEENREIYDKAMAYMKKIINEKVQLDTVFSTESFHYVNKCMYENKDIYEELQRKGFARRVQSSNEKLGLLENNQLNAVGNAEKKGDLQPRGKLQQSLNSKPNARSTKPVSSTAENILKTTAAATSKKTQMKQTGKEISELQSLRLQNAKLSGELAYERQKSKALLQENKTLKEKASANSFNMLDSAIQKVQNLMVKRSQHISSDDTDNLEEIYDVIQAKFPCGNLMSQENFDLHEKVEKAILEYKNAVEEIGVQEKESSELSEVIAKRDESCQVARDLMKMYLESWNDGDHLTEKVVYLKKLLLEMKQKYKQYLKGSVTSDERSLEELVGEYKENKLKNKSSMETALKNTNDALNQFSSIIDNLKKGIMVHDGRGNDEDDNCKAFNSATFAERLKEVQKTVDAEMSMRNKASVDVAGEKLMATLVKILVKEIETPLEITLQQIKDCKQYSLLYPELCSSLTAKPDTSKIYEIRKEIKTLKSKLRHKLADKKDLEESDEMNTSALNEIKESLYALLHELHTCFKMEHEEMMKLGNAYKMHFRELNISNPDLCLSSYLECQGLVKEHWEIEHFNCCSLPGRPGICYTAKFCDEPVVIKEFHLNSDEYQRFLNKVRLWHSIKEDNVVPVHAVFRSKVGFQTYAVFPHFPTLEESEKEHPLSQVDACHILQDVLKGLSYIHPQGLAHSQLNPSTILIKSNTAILDFSLNFSHVNTVSESKGISFCPPEKEISQASDMYNFGCLILWMLFPNLQFSRTTRGVLDIAGYKSIVQDLLSVSSYKAIVSLLSVNASSRHCAKTILEKGIFGELIKRSSEKEQSPLSSAVSTTSEETSVVVSATQEECSGPDVSATQEECSGPAFSTTQECSALAVSATQEECSAPAVSAMQEECSAPAVSATQEDCSGPAVSATQEECSGPAPSER